LKPAQRVEQLFLAAVARRPTREELQMAEKLYISHLQRRELKGDATQASLAAAQDVWWAVLNSNEFIMNH
jgi:hypothetical protein